MNESYPLQQNPSEGEVFIYEWCAVADAISNRNLGKPSFPGNIPSQRHLTLDIYSTRAILSQHHLHHNRNQKCEKVRKSANYFRWIFV